MEIQLNENQLSEINDMIEKLSKCFDEKISELHQVKGGQTERHAFCYYRQLVWSIKDNLNQSKQVK